MKGKYTARVVIVFGTEAKNGQIANSSTLSPNNNVLTIEDVNYFLCFVNLQIENSWGKQYQLNVGKTTQNCGSTYIS